MQIHQLKPNPKRKRKQIGRGGAHGTHATRGMKGQKARSGRGGLRKGFEGTTNPLFRRTPKLRGFKSIHEKNNIINVSDIEKNFKEGDTINPLSLAKASLVPDGRATVKILGDGDVNKKFIIINCKVSKSAAEKIKKAGGEIKELINI